MDQAVNSGWFKNLSWLTTEKLARILLGFLLWAYLARVLPLDDLGKYSIAIAIVSILYCFTNPGVTGILTRDLINSPSNQEQILGSAFFIQLCGALLASLVAILLFQVIDFEKGVALYVAILSSTLFFRLSETSRCVFEVNENLQLYAKFELLLLLVFIGAKMVAAHHSQPVIAVILVSVIEAVCSSIFAVALVGRQYLQLSKLQVIATRVRHMFTEGLPLLFGMATSLLNMRMDQIMVGKILGVDQAGLYASASKVSEAWLVIPSIIGPLIYPKVIRLYSSSRIQYRQFIKRVLFMASLFAIVAATLISFLADLIIQVLYGEKFSGATSVLKILIWSGVPYIAFFVVTQIIQVKGLTKIIYFSSLLSLCCNFILNMTLIPSMGIVGGAVSTSIAAILGVSFSSLYVLLKK